MAQSRSLLCLLTLLLTAGAPSASAALKDYPFRLLTIANAEQEEIVAENKGPSPITVLVSLTGKNVSANWTWPSTTVVPPGASVAVGAVSAADSTQPYDYTLSYSYYVGRIDANPDANVAYRLPYQDGLTFPITQAYGAPLTSHNNVQNRYAVDFAMPEGTPIVAARAGVVVDVTLTYHKGGYDHALIDMANTVTVVHEDGTIAEYAHLAPGTPLVQRGQRVRVGQLLAYSGNTGFSSAPHLHFVVSKPGVRNGKLARVSLPILFYANEPRVVFAPQTGTSRTAAYADSHTEDTGAVAVAGSVRRVSALRATGSARTSEVEQVVPPDRR